MKAGWEVISIGDLIGRGESIDPTKKPDEEFDYIDVSSVSNQTFEIIETQKLKGLDAPSRAKRRVRSNDVIFATIRPTLKRVAVVPEALNGQVCSTGYIVLRALPKLHHKYLFYYLLSAPFQTAMEQLQSGASYPAVTDSQVREQLLPVPPLEEQQRIVAILDEAFDGLDRARDNAQTNLENVEELFDSKRRVLLTTNADTWETRTLNDVCVVERGSSPRPIKEFLTENESGVNWVKIGDTKFGSKYVVSTKEKITKEGAEKSRAVHVGDFILTNSMTYGRPYIMGIDGCIHDGWFVLRLKNDLDRDFFFHVLSSTVVQEQFHQLAAGSVVKNISSDLVKKTILCIPPIDVQLSLASQLDSISYDIERVELAYRAKLQDLDDLRQSLLQKAFAGELT